MFGMVVSLVLEIEQFDVRHFCYSDLAKEIYVEKLEGFKVKVKENLVYRSKKSLYVLMQAAR